MFFSQIVWSKLTVHKTASSQVGFSAAPPKPPYIFSLKTACVFSILSRQYSAAWCSEAAEASVSPSVSAQLRADSWDKHQALC